jgi:hypothetical protein
MKDNDLKVYFVTATRPAYVTHTYEVRAINEEQAEAQAMSDIRLGTAQEIGYLGAEFMEDEVLINGIVFDRYLVPSDIRAFDEANFGLIEQAEEN